MQFGIIMQCFCHQQAALLVQQARFVAHLPTDFFYFNILQEAFFCHFCGQSQEWEKEESATYRVEMKLV